MGTSPPSIPEAPNFHKMLDESPIGFPAPPWQQWFKLLFNRVGGALGHAIEGDVAVFETTVGQAALASAGTVALLDALVGERWKIREIFLSGAGTNFSGGGGDRLLSITDGTSTWSVVPAATLQSLAVARWGDTGVPFPATAAHLTAASVESTDISVKYSGGATDYTAGSLTLVIVAERTQ